MEPSIELRKVPVGSIYNLVQVLEYSQSWKKLMALIPKDLESKDFIPKYGTDHMKLIENASLQQKRPCTEILMEEWGTSGRKRPSLYNLLQLLVDAELYRAADIVAVDLLNGTPAQRPSDGPAADVDISLSRLIAEKESNKKDIESLLDNMSYPSLASDNLHTYNKNLDKNIVHDKSYGDHKMHLGIPVECKNESKTSLSPSNATDSTNISSSVSDMIKFSSEINMNSMSITNNSYEMPAISILLHDKDKPEKPARKNKVFQVNSANSLGNTGYSTGLAFHTETSDLPNIEAMNLNVTNSNSGSLHSNSASQYNIPDISGIQICKESSNINSNNINLLSKKQYSDSELIADSKSYDSESYSSAGGSEFNMPMLSAFQNNVSEVQAESNTASLPITSASLNTALPHHLYADLENATNNFNDSLYKEGDSSARKIGSGGFGTVYLACGLLNRPVAVKRLTFIGPTGNYSEEIISRQFKTEVEILSKYNHSNILSLLGYSCDGPSYCLIYEYVEGGSLRESIANRNLSAQDRLNIAFGSAKGIDYLHNGYPTPLIHRDVKSANILLTKLLIPKLCDFGLIKLLPDQTVTSNVMGTTAYMAPEAFRGDVSVKMDVFSFGVVILELLTGLAPLVIGREGTDIISHVEEVCEEGRIAPLLDASAGPWPNAEEFFKVSNRCFEEKRKRPFVKEVVELVKKRALAYRSTMKTYGRKKADDATDIIVNLDELCRLCLAREEQLLPIFNDDEPIPLSIRIMACVALEVLEDDGLPAMICHPCHYQLEKYYVFRKKCESSDTKLRRHYKQLSDTTHCDGDKADHNTLPLNSEQDIVGSSVTFIIPEEGEPEADEEEEEGREVEGKVITLPQPMAGDGDPRQHCTLKREMPDDEAKEDERPVADEGLERAVEAAVAHVVSEGVVEGDTGEGLSVRVLPSVDAPTHVEVTTEDGSVLLMELTTDDFEIPIEPERDENGELCLLRCDQCPRAFARKAQLRRHSSVHSTQRGVTCSHCDKWFPSQSALKRHERIHTGEKPFQCGVCLRCFAQKEILFRHLLIHSDTKPFNCSTCGKGFTQREPLRLHRLTHLSPRPALRLHRCNLCTKLFCHASGLSRHLLTHTGRSYKCRDCDKSFNDKSSLRRHHRITGHQAAT